MSKPLPELLPGDLVVATSYLGASDFELEPIWYNELLFVISVKCKSIEGFYDLLFINNKNEIKVAHWCTCETFKHL